MVDTIWTIQRGEGPCAATAIHDGRSLRDELDAYPALDEPSRVHKEDPCVAHGTELAAMRLVGLRSRFEVDAPAASVPGVLEELQKV